MRATEDQIAHDLTQRAYRLGVSVYLPAVSHVVADGVPCSGYFDAGPEVPVLAVAWDNPMRLGVLLHEYCHATQWVERAPVWVADEKTGSWADWLAGDRIRNPRAALESAREIEADCERRTIRLAKELGAPLDLERYARGANAYVHFYNVMAKTRKWFRIDRRPHMVDEVLAAANPTIDADFSKTPKPLWDALMGCV